MLEHCDTPPVPKHVLANADRASLRGNESTPSSLVNGPFKMVTWERGQKVVLEANDKFTGPEMYKPKIKRVIFRIIPEYATRLIELETGGIDMMDGLQIADVDRLRKEHPELTFYRRGWRTRTTSRGTRSTRRLQARRGGDADGQQIDLTKVKPNTLFGDKRCAARSPTRSTCNKIIDDMLTSETGEAYARPAIGTVTPALCNVYNDK